MYFSYLIAMFIVHLTYQAIKQIQKEECYSFKFIKFNLKICTTTIQVLILTNISNTIDSLKGRVINFHSVIMYKYLLNT